MTGTSRSSGRTPLTALAALLGCAALTLQPPLTGIPALTAGSLGRAGTATTAVVLVAAAVLLVHRSARFWAPLLLVGSLLVCLGPLVQRGLLQYQGVLVPVGLVAARPLTLVGVLAAAQALFTGAEGLRRSRSGLVVAGVAVGAAWVLPPGLSLDVLNGGAQQQSLDGTVLAPMVLGVAGGLLAVLVEGSVPRGTRRRDPAGPGAEVDAGAGAGARADAGAGARGPLLRSAAAGALAAVAPLLVSLADPERLARMTGVPADSLARNAFIPLLLAGLFTLVAGLLAGLLAGTRVLLTAALAGMVALGAFGGGWLVTVSVGTRQLLGVDPTGSTGGDLFRSTPAGPALTPGLVLLLGLAGLAVGSSVAATRYRAWPAAALVAGVAAALMLAWVATGGDLSKIAARQVTVPVMVLHVLVVAAVTASAVAVAAVLVRRGALVVALGPLLTLFVLGGQNLRVGLALQRDDRNGFLGLYTGFAATVPSAVLLAVAAAGLVLLALLPLRSPEGDALQGRPEGPGQPQGTPPATSSATEPPAAGSRPDPEPEPERSW